jgi:hypothetical protein
MTDIDISVRETHPRGPVDVATDIQLLKPANDVAEPEVSIVIPALDEELTIEDFVEWCHEGLRLAGARGEVIIDRRACPPARRSCAAGPEARLGARLHRRHPLRAGTLRDHG